MFNAKKSIGLCFGQEVAFTQNLFLGNETVGLINGTLHMGVPLATDQPCMKQIILQRVETIEKETDVTMTLGSRNNPLPPLAARKVYLSMDMCIPRLLYGLEMCTLSDECFVNA